MTSTPFDDLPDEALKNVLRSLSSKPSKKNWAGYLDFEDALMAVNYSSALGEVATAAHTDQHEPRNPGGRGPVLHLPNGVDISLLMP